MKTRINYFGMLAELAGCQSEEIIHDALKVGDLVAVLRQKYPALSTKTFQVCQNLQIVGADSDLETSEVVLLPPFSGG